MGRVVGAVGEHLLLHPIRALQGGDPFQKAISNSLIKACFSFEQLECSASKEPGAALVQLLRCTIDLNIS